MAVLAGTSAPGTARCTLDVVQRAVCAMSTKKKLPLLPSGLWQEPASSSLQGYPFGSDWYALVGAFKRRYCPS